MTMAATQFEISFNGLARLVGDAASHREAVVSELLDVRSDVESMTACRNRIEHLHDQYLYDYAISMEAMESEAVMRALTRYYSFQDSYNPSFVRETALNTGLVNTEYRVFDHPDRFEDHTMVFHRTLEGIRRAVFQASVNQTRSREVISEVGQLKTECVRIIEDANFYFQCMVECEMALIGNRQYAGQAVPPGQSM